MNHDSIDDLLTRAGLGRLPVDDPFFSDTYEACQVFRRVGITVEDDEDLCHRPMEEFQCNAPNCDAIFRNLADYEVHYNGSHRYTCEECKTTRPNARLLDIHMQETHDSFFKVSSRKRPMYQCYVAECDAKFADPRERGSHCATIHRFPPNFRYESEATEDARDPSEVVERSESAPIPMDGSPPTAKVLRPRMEGSAAPLERRAEANASTRKPNILESGGLMDLLDELPDRRVGDET